MLLLATLNSIYPQVVDFILFSQYYCVKLETFDSAVSRITMHAA